MSKIKYTIIPKEEIPEYYNLPNNAKTAETSI